jgi:phenylpropionate dioxygenase-like ring-hydroxylating dioxygenase large terminal subunit
MKMRDIDNKTMIYDVARELLDLMARKATHQAEAIKIVPADYYLSEERFALEKAEVFRKYPLIVAFSCELPNPGDYRLHEDTGVPVIVSRQKDGRVRAFLNACRHRGAKITSEPCGHATRFTCPYHAWTFGNDGRLLALQGEDAFGTMDKSQLGLIEFPCEEAYGMIFAVLTPGASIDVKVFLGEGADHIANWHFERNILAGERDISSAVNWKLALDTYGENYHFHVLHGQDFNYKVVNCAHHWRWGPNKEHWTLAWPSLSLEAFREKPESEWGDIHAHFSMAHFIFPNTFIPIYPETCTIYHLYPGKSVHEQITQYKLFGRWPDVDAEEQALVEQRLELFAHVVATQDYEMSAGASDNLRTGLLHELYFGRSEVAIGWTHEALDQALGIG